MALSKEDLQAISKIVETAVVASEERMCARMDSAVVASEERMCARMDSAVVASEERMCARMDSAVAASEERTNTKIAETNARIAESEERMQRYFNVVIESKVTKELRIIQEGLSGWNARNRQIDRLAAVQEEHGDRIWALEQAAKI